MRKPAFSIFALLVISGAALAQTSCPPPTITVLCNNQAVPAAGAPLAPRATLQLRPNPACPAGLTYRFTAAELTLLRGPRPLLPTKTVRQPEISLTALLTIAQPGDRLRVFIPYQNLVVVSADGQQHPYPLPALRPDEQRGISANLLTDAAKGVSFNWVLTQK
jgi:hypothetical protein